MNSSPELLHDPFALELDFDINAAFQDATEGILTDEVLSLEEKIDKVASLITNASSETYQSFVDFRNIAAQIEMFCNHDHQFNESVAQDTTVSSFLSSFKDHGHDHGNETADHSAHGKKEREKTKESKKKKKKKEAQKKRKSWFGFYY